MLFKQFFISAKMLPLMLLGTRNIGEGTPVMSYRISGRSIWLPLESHSQEINKRNAQVVCRQLAFGGLYAQLDIFHFTLICMMIMH